ncbi:MAG: hypothetical protein NW206_18175 [Hyphomonadaceae bacterium]|nr:hypothetical protein [Hyphomonadaceae bacterium]
MSQLGLFDDCETLAPKVAPAREQAAAPITSIGSAVVRLNLASHKRVTRPPPPKSARARLINEKDLPCYPEPEIAAVERLVAAISSDRALLGYKDIWKHFGVSKATANRRMKDGLVPGVRIVDGVVMRDGGIRRFSREQVKWLVLAVCFAKESIDA